MTLTSNQIELKRSIQSKLRRGDRNSIAVKLGLSPEYVGDCLSPNTVRFNMKVVESAAEIISMREQNTKKLLETISSL